MYLRKGAKTGSGILRAVNLPSLVYKALEQIVNESLIKDMEVNGKWDKMENGFTKDILSD